MWKLARCTFALVIVSTALNLGALAEETEDPDSAMDLVRTGFYFAGGGSVAFPHQWDKSLEGNLADDAFQILDIQVDDGDVKFYGADVEDPMMGVSAVVGYRASEVVAFELEGEWLFDSNKTDLTIRRLNEDGTVRAESTGSQTAEVEKLWTVTANIKAYPPLTGRFQPFGKVGLGVHHSEVVTDISALGIKIQENSKKTTGVLRFGAGIDIYVTRNIVAEISAGYVVPFRRTRYLVTDYINIQWRAMYRF